MYRPTISNCRVCDLLAFKVNASSCCHEMRLDRGLAEGVRKAAIKANADLAAARAEAQEELIEEAAMLALKRLEEADMDVD